MSNESNVEETAGIEESQTVKRKRGRPRGDYSSLVDTIVNGHRILEVVDGPRSGDGVMVVVECPECGESYTKRLRSLRTEGVKGCSCVRSRIFRAYLDRQISKLSPEVIAGCWVSRKTKTRLQTAAKFGLPIEVVDAAYRKYQTKLDSMVEVGKALHRMVNEEHGYRVSVAEAAAGFSLSVEAAHYLISVAARRIQADNEETESRSSDASWIADRAAAAVKLVEKRSCRDTQQHGKWCRPHELAEWEFQRRKGRLQGSLVPLYGACKQVDRALLNDSQAAAVKEFLDIAESTLANRQVRLARWLASYRNERRQVAAQGPSNGDRVPEVTLAA